MTLFQQCLDLDYHPWHASMVVVIPKHGKPDYGIAKACRPIFLTECTGKILEQVLAARLSWESDSLSLLLIRQFGSCKMHSAKDAASFL